MSEKVRWGGTHGYLGSKNCLKEAGRPRGPYVSGKMSETEREIACVSMSTLSTLRSVHKFC
jgi:hypothetical protein